MSAKISRFFWLDMEMTGLDPEKEVIIETALIVTDARHEELDSYHSIIKQDQSYLDNMDKWNTKQHKKSGLIDLVPKGQPQDKMEEDLLKMADKHCKNEKIVLAGNSIYQDRLFIKKHLPKLSARLHYRMLDVSAWKLIFMNKGIEFKKENKHRALDDVRESVRELRTYLSYLDHKKLN